MFGESLTTTQSSVPGSKTYFVDQAAKPAPGSKFLLQDDPNQEGNQQLAGTYASELAEIVLTKKQKRAYEFGFLFSGSVFYCARD